MDWGCGVFVVFDRIPFFKKDTMRDELIKYTKWLLTDPVGDEDTPDELVDKYLNKDKPAYTVDSLGEWQTELYP